ncbi:MAG TPA: metal-dependent hydrolase, partial [Thermoanaerobaculia bacterium]|nr:metal-dependent hydrolase [Thermoanaerobaculia bacterium]
HSLVMTLVWSCLAAAAYLASTGYAAGALAIALGVTSHWVLDWVSHRPDMPLAPWSETRTGLGLWGSVPATLAVEGLLYGLGIWFYARTTKAADATGRWSLVAFAALLGAIYLGNVFGPPPPSVRALTAVSFTLFLIPLWAGWFDRHRAIKG